MKITVTPTPEITSLVRAVTGSTLTEPPPGRCRDCRGTSRTGTISARRVLLSATVAAAVALLARYVAIHLHDGEAEFD